MSFQQTIVIGNLGQDPEARCTPTGKWVTHFSLAVNERYGERETTTWFRVEAWGKLGELCQQYLAKGRLVMVVGRVSINAFIGHDDKPRANLVLTAETVKFLSAGKPGDGATVGFTGEAPLVAIDSAVKGMDIQALDLDDCPF